MIDPADQTAAALARAVEGQFRLEREIGRGGMGVVYLGTDVQLERPVALKTLPPHLALDPEVRSRFVREARTAAALSHPNIVPVYHAAERDGVVYFAMGYVPGESVAERIARAGPIPIDELCSILIGLAEALGYAHSRGVVHRDVKAENVLIDSRTGRVMVTDFGIARVTEAQPTTATGTVLGTVHYMSPEQVIGDVLDGRSDLYALGVLAFYGATGRFPLERSTAPAVLVAHVNSAPPRLHEYDPDAPDWLDAVIAKLLEKRPVDRYSNADELLEALRARTSVRTQSDASTQSSGRALTGGDSARAYHREQDSAEQLSADDAQQIWARAAELQANTGVMTPPPAFALRPTDAEAAITRGFDVAMVRASAEEAGIPVQYVDRALAERANSVEALVVPGEAMSRTPNLFLGSRTRIEFESVLDGELTDQGFEEIADEVRLALGEMITISAVGRTLSVSSTESVGGGRARRPRVLQLHVSSRNGQTKIAAFENLRAAAGVSFSVGMGAGGVAGGTAIMGAVMVATRNPILAAGAWGAWFVAAYFGARGVYAHTTRKREVELRSLVERIARCAQAHTVKRLGK